MLVVTHKGRQIEIIAPATPYGQCAFTVNGQGPRSGERFTGQPGVDPSALLDQLKAQIDALDAQGPEGIKGTPGWTWLLRPGSWEECPSPGLNAHIKPVDAPCNEQPCRARAAKRARQKARAAERHPSASALTRQLILAGFPQAAENGRDTEGFRVHTNEPGQPRSGVRVVWYDRGYLLPMTDRPGRCQEIADHLTGRGVYAVHYEGGPRVDVMSKTHGARAQ